MAFQSQSPANDFGRFDIGRTWRTFTLFTGGARPQQPSNSYSDYGFIDTIALLQRLGVDFLPLTYQIALGKLGGGEQTDIYQAMVNVQTSFAFKAYGTLSRQQTYDFRDLINEIVMLTHPLIRNHPHIVKLEGFSWDLEEDDDIFLALVFEKAHMGDLNHFITSGLWTDISVAERLSICADIGIAVRDMHSNGIVHGDLRPGNVLVFKDKNGKYIGKVADFGASTGSCKASDLVKMPGSAPWNAPENYHLPVPLVEAKKMDIYSFGALCFWVLFKRSGSTSTSATADSTKKQRQGLENLMAQRSKTTLLDLALLSLAKEGEEEEGLLLDSNTKTQLVHFFKASVSYYAENRIDDISKLVLLLVPERRKILPVEPIQFGPIPEFESFEVSSCIYQLYEADFRLRFFVIEELQSLLSGSATAQYHAFSENIALQLALCYQLGCGVTRDVEIARKYLDDYRIPETNFNDRLKWVMGASGLSYQKGLFKSLYNNSHILPLGQTCYYRRKNQLEIAHEIYSKEISDLNAALGIAHPLTIVIISQFLRILKDMDCLQEAEALDLRSIYLLGESLDSTNERFEPVLLSMMNLASIYKLQGNWKKSEELNFKILSWLKRGKYSNHPIVMIIYTNLAIIYRSQGRLEKAENLALELMEKRRISFGVDHVDTLASMANLSHTLCETGKWIEAEALEQEVVAKSKVVLGPDHPLTTTWMSNLAAIYRKLGRYHESLELMSIVMSNAQKTVGLYHPDSLTYTAQVAWLVGINGDIQHAQRLLTHVVTARQRILGPDNPSLLTSMNDLASMYRLQGSFDEAEKLELRVIEKSIYILGKDHINTLLSQGNLAIVYRKQKRLKEAEKLERQVLTMTIQRFGDQSPDSLWSMSNLGTTLYDLGQYDEAEKYFTHVMKCRSQLLGPKNLSTLIATGNLSMTYQMQKKFQKAVELESKVLLAYTEVLGENHHDTLVSMNNLAANLRGLGLHDESVELMAECVRRKQQMLGVEHALTKVSQSILGNWCAEPDFSDEEMLDWCSQFSTIISEQISPLCHDETAIQHLGIMLSDILRAFFRRLAYVAKTQEHYNFANYVLYRYTELISCEIQRRLSERIDIPILSLEERTVSWEPDLDYDKTQISLGDLENTTSNSPLPLSVDDLVQQEICEPASREVKKSRSEDNSRVRLNAITQTMAYSWLASKIKVELQLSSPKSNILYTIRDQITTLFFRHRQIDKNPLQLADTIAFEIGCDPVFFLRNHHFEGANSFENIISKLITLTSDGKDTQALTCEEYMKQTWPHGGQKVLSLFVQIVESGRGVVQFDEGSIEGWIADSKVCILATGMFEMIVETAEQLAWLGCVLRSSPFPRAIFNCTPSIKSICYMSFRETSFEERSNAGFYCSIEYNLQATAPTSGTGLCWHKLFLFTVVALNFPILRRADFVHGLEMQLSTIFTLC